MIIDEEISFGDIAVSWMYSEYFLSNLTYWRHDGLPKSSEPVQNRGDGQKFA